MANIKEADLRTGLCNLVRMQKTSLGLEVSIPVVFPNGNNATVVVNPDGSEFVVHDASAAVNYLTSEGIKVSSGVRSRLALSVTKYGCHLQGNRVAIHCPRYESIPLAVVAVANASRAVSDYVAEVRRAMDGDFKEAVLDHLRSVAGSRVRENEQVRGGSGRMYRVPGLILDREERRPVAFVSAIPNRAAIPGQLTELFDLKDAHEDVLREAIYDENSDLREEDRRLMERVSKLVPFAQARTSIARMLNG